MKRLWHFNPKRCLICDTKIADSFHPALNVIPHIELRFCYDPKDNTRMVMQGRLCVDCTVKLFKEKKRPKIRVEWEGEESSGEETQK